MGLLQEAQMEQSSAKMAWFGPQGSGKTMSASMVALGLALNFHKGAPVAFFDTEKGSDFADKLFKVEGVRLLRTKSRAFTDLLQTVKEAEAAGCCALIVDSMTHVWSELQDAFVRKKKIKRIEFQHWREIKETWRTWTDLMLNSPLHMLICGRAGKEYEYQENEESGRRELVSTGTKFKAEGEFGYEPDVLVELWPERQEGVKHGSQLVHKALVLKDRTWTLNGHEFTWIDQDKYVKGYYEKVATCFAPYVRSLNVGGTARPAIAADRTSENLFDASGDTAAVREQKQKSVVLGELKETFTLLWPGSTNDAKQLRIRVSERVFKCRSWEGIEQARLSLLEHGLKVLRRFEEMAKAKPPKETDQILTLLDEAMQKIADEQFEIEQQDSMPDGQPVPF